MPTPPPQMVNDSLTITSPLNNEVFTCRMYANRNKHVYNHERPALSSQLICGKHISNNYQQRCPLVNKCSTRYIGL